jgi:hypothetical protein
MRCRPDSSADFLAAPIHKEKTMRTHRAIWAFQGLLVMVVFAGLAPGQVLAEFITSPSGGGSYEKGFDPIEFIQNTTSMVQIGNARTIFFTPWNAYEIFDLRSLPGPVTALTLAGHVNFPPILLTVPAGLSVSLYDVTTSPAALAAMYPQGSATGLQIYNDLGSGNVYGNFGVDTGIPPLDDSGQDFQVRLNARAVGDAEAARLGSGFLVIGFTSLPLIGSPIFNSGQLSGVTLSIEVVPEPSALLLLSLGGAVLLGGRVARATQARRACSGTSFRRATSPMIPVLSAWH